MVIIEYGLNDIIYPGELEAAKRARKSGVNGGSVGGPYGDAADLLLTSERLAFERVLRVVLGLPSRPAVLLLEAFSYTHSKATLGGFATLPQDTHAVLACLLYTPPTPRDRTRSCKPSPAWQKKTQKPHILGCALYNSRSP